MHQHRALLATKEQTKIIVILDLKSKDNSNNNKVADRGCSTRLAPIIILDNKDKDKGNKGNKEKDNKDKIAISLTRIYRLGQIDYNYKLGEYQVFFFQHELI